MEFEQQYYELYNKYLDTIFQRRRKLFDTLEKHKNINRNANLLSLKYQYINFIVNVVHISIIIISIGLSIFESIVQIFAINAYGIELVPIVFSSLIALMLSILRFYKLDAKKKTLHKVIEKHIYICSLLGSQLQQLKDFDMNSDQDPNKAWISFKTDLEKGDLNNIMSSTNEEREKLFTFSEKLHYLNMYVHKDVLSI